MGNTNRKTLKRTYYLTFLTLIALPILIVFIVSLPIIHTIVKQQAIENINLAQTNIATTLHSEMQEMSMRLSHLIYTNNNEIIDLAAGTDSLDTVLRYEYGRRLDSASSLAIVPISDIVSISFYMKSGRNTYYKSPMNITWDEISRTDFYRHAVETPNTVYIGSYNTNVYNKIYNGALGGELMLAAGIVPDISVDRTGKIAFVTLFELSEISKLIKKYDNAYLAGENSIGLSALIDRADEGGKILYTGKMDVSMVESYLAGTLGKAYTTVSTPVDVGSNRWEIVSIVKTTDLTRGYNFISLVIVLVICTVLLLFVLFSRMFLRNIINPIADMRNGLKQVEEGYLEIHLQPQGNYELQAMIHSFNAMVRRLKALISEYEEKVGEHRRSPEKYLKELLERRISPQELQACSKEFFHDKYLLIGFSFIGKASGDFDQERLSLVSRSLDRIPWFALRCTMVPVYGDFAIAYYRIDRELKMLRVVEMLDAVRRTCQEEYEIDISVILSSEYEGCDSFFPAYQDILRKRRFVGLFGPDAIVDLSQDFHADYILTCSESYRKLAHALYIADEKTVADEKERLNVALRGMGLDDSRLETLGFVLACVQRFEDDHADFSEVFGVRLNYVEKLYSLEDVRSVSLWLNNCISRIFEYALSKLDLNHADSIIRAKRYLADNYMRSDLSLKDVADYVELNEKYFTTKFSSQCGETFQSYLTGLRIQNAKELIRTTSFKMYEIAQMVGYANPEHFNRIFKKEVGMSPNQYRKNG